MTLLLAIALALPSERLAVRLEPVRTALAQAQALLKSGLPDSAKPAIGAAANQWSEFTKSPAADSMPRPEGWNDDAGLISARFSALDSTPPTDAGLAALDELLYWLPRPKPLLLKFTGYKCEKCVVMEQVLGKVATEYSGRARIKTIDVNKDEESARKYRITVVPTMVFLDAAGKEVSRVAREMTEAEVRARLDLLLKHS